MHRRRKAMAEADSLHCEFIETAEGPRQLRAPVADFEIAFVDLSHEPDARASASREAATSSIPSMQLKFPKQSASGE